MRKVLFLLVALMMSAAVKSQEIEKVDKFTSGYINGTYMNKYKTIDGVLYAGPIADAICFVVAIILIYREMKWFQKALE